ncbi:MAG TPA: fluoride efflux transporter CrcB [Polyangiaceae bacterium]
MDRFLLICLAGALGTGTRYLVSVWAAERFGASFPYGTLFVNLAGCFAIGFVMHVALNVAAFSPTLRLAITAGFLGGLTTYSSFNYETTKLLLDGSYGLAAWNFAATAGGGFAAGLGGLALGRVAIG